MSMEFLDQSMSMYNTYNMYGGPQMQQQQIVEHKPAINPAMFETPEIKTGGTRFTIKKDGADTIIPVDRAVPDVVKKERKKRSKSNSSSGEIVRAEEQLVGTVEETPTAYTYMETTNMLRETLGQIDTLNAELMQEFEAVKHSRTMKNKYNTLVGLSENVGALLNGKISAIREINSCITKANEMDYKKGKDMRAAQAGMDDDKYIADLYKSFISNPTNIPPQPQMPNIDPAVFGSGIVRADIKSGDITGNGVVDAGYLNYMSNLSPEQNMMRYESNPNVKQVVVFDYATGNKFFQVMDITTGQVIPNVPCYDDMFMEDTTLDLKTKIAKNLNLNETFPIITINEGATLNQY